MSAALEQAQSCFAEAVNGGGIERLAPLLVDGANAAIRMRLYRRNVEAGWAAALANAYPVVRALVGVDYFVALSHAYGNENPSRSGDLNRFGADLPAFVAHHESAALLSYLADVAALEWAVHRADYAADHMSLQRERIMRLTPAELLAERFSLQPACAWMRSAFPIESIWRAHQRNGDANLPINLCTAETALVVRIDWRTQVLPSSGAETAVLAQLRAGACVGAAIEAGLSEDRRFDFALALVRWLDIGLLAG